jgi:hypothetical protein
LYRLHLLELEARQPSGLEQDAVGNADLADIMERPSLTQEKPLFLAHAQGLADPRGQTWRACCPITSSRYSAASARRWMTWI